VQIGADVTMWPGHKMSLKSIFTFFYVLIFYKSFISVHSGPNSMLIFQAVPEMQPFQGGMYPKLKLQENAKF